MKTKNIDTLDRIFIVAEIGNNHEGNFETAISMIDEASKSGADAVKFQTFIPESFISNIDKKRLDRLKTFQFSFDQFEKLSFYAQKKGLIFFSTPLDLESAIFLNKICPLLKISSGDNNFIPLINKIVDLNKPLIISTGLMDMKGVEKLYNHINNYSKGAYNQNNLAFLHCVSSYPVPDEQSNLNVIRTLQNNFDKIATIGYSDHTIGNEACIAAASIGARIIEKHFTLDKNFSSFRDHKLSSNPTEFKLMVKNIRKIERLLGSEKKSVQDCEKELIVAARRSISSKETFEKGKILEYDDLVWLRPATGISPGEESRVLGKKLNKTLKKGTIIKSDDFE